MRAPSSPKPVSDTNTDRACSAAQRSRSRRRASSARARRRLTMTTSALRTRSCSTPRPRSAAVVERDALLVAVDAQEPQRIRRRGTAAPTRGSRRRVRPLDLHDLGAHVAEQHGRIGARDRRRQIDDPDAGQEIEPGLAGLPGQAFRRDHFAAFLRAATRARRAGRYAGSPKASCRERLTSWCSASPVASSHSIGPRA